ncbi:hypothetical protein AB0A77_26325 [Streptomyces varsoviensis]|uniref:hypothetical protein n=1 Tax=Streptomyces varsoviensis TaxID=67373 RepID=UPI0033FEDFA3
MTDPDLSADWLTTWRHDITALLQQTLACFEAAYGYPPGDNHALSADNQSRFAAEQLADAGSSAP